MTPGARLTVTQLTEVTTSFHRAGRRDVTLRHTDGQTGQTSTTTVLQYIQYYSNTVIFVSRSAGGSVSCPTSTTSCSEVSPERSEGRATDRQTEYN